MGTWSLWVYPSFMSFLRDPVKGSTSDLGKLIRGLRVLGSRVGFGVWGLGFGFRGEGSGLNG